MRGSHTSLSSLKYAATIAFTIAAMLVASAPVEAHELSNTKRQRNHIKSRARSALGSPYRSGGESRRGFDCSGFTRWTFLNHGANLPHSSSSQYGLARRSAHRRIHERRNLRRGDLVFFKTTSATVGHVGIYLGRGRFISSTSSSGVRVDSVYDRYYWGRRWVGGTRLAATRYNR